MSGSRSIERQLQSFLGQQAMALSLSEKCADKLTSVKKALNFLFFVVVECPHPTHFASDLLHRRLCRSQDVADVTAVLPTAVVEAGHVRARWKFVFLFSWI